MATHKLELATLRDKARSLGHVVTLFYNEAGVVDQAYVIIKRKKNIIAKQAMLLDPLSAAELLRKVCA